MKEDLRDNGEEYIEDPNIFLAPDGSVKYVTESKERKRVVYEPLGSSKYEMEKVDTFEGSFNASLVKAK